MKKSNKTDMVKAESFMGLMAANGYIPGVSCAEPAQPDFIDQLPQIMDKIEYEFDAVSAHGINFFELLVSEGMMKPAANQNKPKRRFEMRIVRPYNLGGDLPLSA